MRKLQVKGSTHCLKGHPYTIRKSGKRVCNACFQEYMKKVYYPAHKGFVSARGSRYRAKLKRETLTHYGKRGKLQCCWAGCEIKDIDMLSLDHVNNDGKQHREAVHKGSTTAGTRIYNDVKSKGFPKGFQTLCFNHQMKKEITLRRADRELRQNN